MQHSILKSLRIAVLIGFVLLSGCEEQKPPEGKMACSDDSECPSGWFCSPFNSRCYSLPEDDDAGDEGNADTSE